jgi:hypothetical protein
VQQTVYSPRLRERVWTLSKREKRIDAEPRFHGESYGWECQCLHDGVLAFGQRYVMKEGALREAEAQRRRLVSEGWVGPATVLPTDRGND